MLRARRFLAVRFAVKARRATVFRYTIGIAGGDPGTPARHHRPERAPISPAFARPNTLARALRGHGPRQAHCPANRLGTD